MTELIDFAEVATVEIERSVRGIVVASEIIDVRCATNASVSRVHSVL